MTCIVFFVALLMGRAVTTTNWLEPGLFFYQPFASLLFIGMIVDGISLIPWKRLIARLTANR